MTVQKSAASSAFDNLSRNTTSTSPPTKVTSTILMAREPMSWRRRLVMASWSRLAISAASDSATPSRRDQTRRRLTVSSHCHSYFCGPLGRAPFGQFIQNPAALPGAHAAPAGDFINSASTSEAKAATRIESADFDARRFDHGTIANRIWRDHKRRSQEGNRAIVARPKP